MLRYLVAVLTLAAALVLAGCGSSAPPGCSEYSRRERCRALLTGCPDRMRYRDGRGSCRP